MQQIVTNGPQNATTIQKQDYMFTYLVVQILQLDAQKQRSSDCESLSRESGATFGKAHIKTPIPLVTQTLTPVARLEPSVYKIIGRTGILYSDIKSDMILIRIFVRQAKNILDICLFPSPMGTVLSKVGINLDFFCKITVVLVP